MCAFNYTLQSLEGVDTAASTGQLVSSKGNGLLPDEDVENHCLFPLCLEFEEVLCWSVLSQFSSLTISLYGVSSSPTDFFDLAGSENRRHTSWKYEANVIAQTSRSFILA